MINLRLHDFNNTKVLQRYYIAKLDRCQFMTENWLSVTYTRQFLPWLCVFEDTNTAKGLPFSTITNVTIPPSQYGRFKALKWGR
jgi:hypothetical protein